MTDTASPAPGAAKAGAKVASEALEGVQSHAQTAFAKTAKLAVDAREFQSGNVEALVEVSKRATQAAETIRNGAAAYAKNSFEKGTAAVQSMTSAKSPGEVFELQQAYLKESIEAAAKEVSRVTQAWMEMLGSIAEPVSNRFNAAMEKAKSNGK